MEKGMVPFLKRLSGEIKLKDPLFRKVQSPGFS